MVKSLDDKPMLPDHIGWRLWLASRDWHQAFVGAMKAAGNDWFTETRAGLMGHIPRGGVRQSALIERVGTTKQAVQQILDGLELEGVVERVADEGDKRGKFVRYTPKGLAALKQGDRIKGEIEAGYRERLGEARFAALMNALRTLTSGS